MIQNILKHEKTSFEELNYLCYYEVGIIKYI